MTMTIEHILNLAPGPDRVRLTRESVQRVLICGLAPHDRELFFPKVKITPAEEHIFAHCGTFAGAGAVHLVMQFLAQEQMVPKPIRNRINATKAALFFPACAQRVPPPPPMPDPVAQYGWDRVHQADMIKSMQDQCASLYLACDRLGFVAATPEMAQYTRDDPAKSYKDLASYLLSPLYSLIFVAKMKAGVQGLRDLLADLFTKLAVLYEAAGEQVSAQKPLDVIVSLCTDVGLPALKGQELNGQAADEIRHLFDTIQELSTHVPQFQFQFNTQNIASSIVCISQVITSASLVNTIGIAAANEVGNVIMVPVGGITLPVLAEQLIGSKVLERVKAFGEGAGRQHGLWQ